MYIRYYAAALCASAALGAPASAATVSTYAEISQLKLELIDLDPADGIIPAITLEPRTMHAVSETYSSISLGEKQQINTVGSTRITHPRGEAGGQTGPTAVSSSATATQFTQGQDVFQSNAGYSYLFTLTPNTGLIVSALGTLSLEQPPGNYSYASLNLTGELGPSAWPDSELVRFGANYATDNDGVETSASFNLSGYLFTQDQAQSGTLSMYTHVVATLTRNVAAPVPEPGAWMMLLAGAGLIGARARRHARARKLPSPDRFA